MTTHYKVLVMEEPGCATFDVSWSGLCIDILSKLEEALNFTTNKTEGRFPDQVDDFYDY
jgi:hypothetical protein